MNTPTTPARPSRRRRARGLGLVAAVAAALVGSNLVEAEAAAAIPPVLKPPPENQRKIQFNFGFGPSSRIGGSGWYYDYYCGNPNNPRSCGWAGGYGGAFKMHQELMFHLTGKWHGPALGIMTQEEFAGGGYFGFNIAPKFAYDIQVVKGLALLISPFVSLGYHLSHWNYYWYNYYGYTRANYSAANLQFGVTGKLMIAQRWLVWLQVPSFDMHIGPGTYYCAPGVPGCGTYFAARFDVLAGGGVAF